MKILMRVSVVLLVALFFCATTCLADPESEATAAQSACQGAEQLASDEKVEAYDALLGAISKQNELEMTPYSAPEDGPEMTQAASILSGSFSDYAAGTTPSTCTNRPTKSGTTMSTMPGISTTRRSNYSTRLEPITASRSSTTAGPTTMSIAATSQQTS